MAQHYAKTRTPISTDTWTPISPPIHCHYFALKNSDGTSILLRTDPEDPQTEDRLPGNAQESVVSSYDDDYQPGGASAHARFKAGEPICWVQAIQGVGPVIATWVS